MHLVLGDEDLLVERAVAEVLRAARKRAGTDDIPVNRMRAGDVGTYELAELLSPSLFADERVVVLEAAAEAGKDTVAMIAPFSLFRPSEEAISGETVWISTPSQPRATLPFVSS